VPGPVLLSLGQRICIRILWPRDTNDRVKTGVKTARGALFTLAGDTVAVLRTIHGTKTQGGFVPLSVALLRAAGTVYRQCTAKVLRKGW